MSLNIRNKFLIPTLLLISVGMSVSSFISYRLSKNALEETKIDQISQTANSTVTILQSWFDNRKLDVKNWANEDTFVTALKDNFLGKAARKKSSENLTRMVEDYKFYEALNITDSKGNILASSQSEIIGKINVGDRQYFKDALRGNLFISKVLKSKTTGSPIVVVAAPVKDKELIGGVIFAVVDMNSFNSKFIDPIKIGKTGYAFIIDEDGTFIAHPDKSFILSQNVKDLGYGEMLTNKNTIFEYTHKGIDKIAALHSYDEMGWIVGLNSETEEIYAAVNKLQKISISMVIGMVIGASIIIFFVANSVAGPVKRVVAGLRDAAEGEGDLTKRLEISSKDEVGELSECFNIFVEKVQRIIGEIHSNLSVLSDSATNLSGLSENLAAGSDDSSARSRTVAAAAEEMNANMNSVAAACEQASVNVNMVASATDEMSATVNEIAGNTAKARDVTAEAVTKTETASERMDELGTAAREISKVTETITEISEQTNLLALNATIEAARAGEAGKGFAVVANEIKELARQTASATLEIRQRIDAIQSSTSTTVSEMNDINVVINEVNEIVSTIASAVEEQSASTTEIATNVTQAAEGIGEVNENVAQSSTVSGEISQEISEVSAVADKIRADSTSVNQQSSDLLALAEQLKNTVNQFKLQ